MTKPIEPVAWINAFELNLLLNKSGAEPTVSANPIDGDEPLYTVADIEAAKQEGRREGLEEAAEICAVAAARLRTGKRIPQVDQHVADTLASKADAIRALIEKDSQT